MAKLRDTRIEVKDLEEYLRNHDDFAFELDIFQHALQLGLVAEHGGTYVDSVTGKHRQFDLRVQIQASGRLLLLAVECKNIGNNNPLLVSRIPRERDEAFHEVFHSFGHRAPGDVPGRPRDRAEVLRVSDQGALYPSGRPVGKSTVQVGRTHQSGKLTSADGESYEKWSQAFASAQDLVHRAFAGHELTDSSACLSVVIPVLVVSDGTLWTVDYASKGNPSGSPTQAEEVELFVNRAYSSGIHTNYRISHLHIYTRSRFRNLLSEVVDTDTVMKKAFPHGLVPR